MLKCVTIKGLPEEIKRKWKKFPEKGRARVEFEKAPSDRGTIVRLRFGASSSLRETIRRFKQWVETGEILITKGQPAGRKLGTSRKYDRYAA